MIAPIIYLLSIFISVPILEVPKNWVVPHGVKKGGEATRFFSACKINIKNI